MVEWIIPEIINIKKIKASIMKVKSSLLLLLVCLISVSSTAFAQDDYNGEFFQGMESGFFLRDTENGHREYDCPDPTINTDALKKVNSILGPVQMLLNLANNDIINNAFRSIDTIVNSSFQLIASVDNYRGSEFCSGLLFGSAGSNLVLQLGREILKV